MNARQKYDSAISAFCKCRLNQAKRLFTEAAIAYNHLYELKRGREKNIADLCKLNVGICYYYAGNYYESARLAISLTTPGSKLEIPYIDVNIELINCSTVRKKKSYWERVECDYKDMKKRNLHKEIIRLLRDNPYYLNEVDFIKQMRNSCLALGMHEIAELFNCDLINLN